MSGDATIIATLVTAVSALFAALMKFQMDRISRLEANEDRHLTIIATSILLVTNLQAVVPPTFIPPEHANDNPPATVDPNIVNQWTATTADLHNATLLLHQETAFDTTLIGRWLATHGGA